MKSIKKELDVLRKALKKDKDYYFSWQSNIAMAFYDEDKRNKVRINSDILYIICNNAAKNFLNLLCK